MPAKITDYTVVLLQLPVGANTTAIPCIIDVHVLTVLPGCLSWLSFLAVLPGCPSWLSFLAVLPGCPSWLSFISIIFQGHLRSHLLEVCHLPLQSLLNHLHTEQCTLFISKAIELTSVGLAHTCPNNLTLDPFNVCPE